MTISDTTNRWSYTGDGSTTVFSFGNRAFSAAYLKVFVDGALQTLTTNYTVQDPDDNDGGTVTFVTAPTSGANVVIEREVPALQETVFKEAGPLPAKLIERALDIIAAAVHDRVRVNVRMSATATSALTSLLLPSPAANRLVGWNSDATELVNYLAADLGASTLVSAFMETLLDDTDAATARATLGFASPIPGIFSTINGGPQVGPPVPVGSVFDYAGSSAPSGWLLCFGQNVSRTTYAALFDAIGTTYGAGDGSTTFGIPDLRGRVVAGQDDMGGTSANRLTGLAGGVDGDALGAAGGAETHALTVTELAAHGHGIPGGATSVPSFHSTGAFTDQGTAGSNPRANLTATNNTGDSTPHNNVQPTFILNKIIYAGA